MNQTSTHSDLIYDVGMHKGEDTDFYLRKGFRVVAFEANPELAHYCRQKFDAEITAQKLTIVEGAILDGEFGNADEVTFFTNCEVSEWGTVSSEWARRNETLGTTNETITVKRADFSSCLARFGIPFFMKIDIEGMDVVCLRALLDFEKRPDYISIESEKVHFGKLKEEFSMLKMLGYDRFKAVNQADVPVQKEPQNTGMGRYTGHRFALDSSGLFGSDLGGEWLTERNILRQYRRIFLGYRLFGDRPFLGRSSLIRGIQRQLSRIFGTSVPGWYDTHARHGSVK